MSDAISFTPQQQRPPQQQPFQKRDPAPAVAAAVASDAKKPAPPVEVSSQGYALEAFLLSGAVAVIALIAAGFYTTVISLQTYMNEKVQDPAVSQMIYGMLIFFGGVSLFALMMLVLQVYTALRIKAISL
jgi:hypothetical protein